MKRPKFAKVITSRERDLGGFTVRRLLPATERKMVGPFIFFDHMGPATFPPGQGLDVRPHPHIGLSTVTFLFEGAILHRDNLGYAQVIRPGDVNWMIAGSGIVHSERTPPDLRESGSRLEGIQCWVALPLEEENRVPSFVHHPKAAFPEFEKDGVRLRLLLGEAFGVKSPVQTFSDIFYVDVEMPAGAALTMPAYTRREIGVYLASGAVRIKDEDMEEKSLVVGHLGEDVRVEAKAPSHVMLLGGESLPEGREIWWNFVASSHSKIEEAKKAWVDDRFPKIPGDDIEFIPLPDEPPIKNPPGTIM